jgi:hypothetical protein
MVTSTSSAPGSSSGSRDRSRVDGRPSPRRGVRPGAARCGAVWCGGCPTCPGRQSSCPGGLSALRVAAVYGWRGGEAGGVSRGAKGPGSGGGAGWGRGGWRRRAAGVPSGGSRGAAGKSGDVPFSRLVCRTGSRSMSGRLPGCGRTCRPWPRAALPDHRVIGHREEGVPGRRRQNGAGPYPYGHPEACRPRPFRARRDAP